MKYLFGPEVERVLLFLQGELERAQAGEKSEVLQLLIGRDETVRYRIVDAHTMQPFPPAPTHQLVQLGVLNRRS